jgi:signal transduction histidine kinase
MSSWRGPGSFFDPRSIRFPLARLIVVTVLVGVGLALLSDAFFMLGNVRKDIQRNLTAAANAAGTAASAALVFQDAKAAREVLRMFDAYPEIDAVGLYARDGTRFASYGSAGLLPAQALAIDPAAPEIRMMADAAILPLPIEVDNAPVGTIYLHARLGAYWRTYLTSTATTFLAGFAAGALALILAMRFLDRILQPVQQVAEAANDARLRQDFVPRPIPAGDDEIGDLVRNFNALLTEVEAGRKSLQNQHEELEHLVAARTAELLAAKVAADEANAAKSRFLAAASHDLRQPIHAMNLFQEALNNTPLNEEQRRIANYLTQSTHNLADILNTLLDVSRLEGGTVKTVQEAVPAYALLHSIEAEFAPLALAKQLRFKLYFPCAEMVLFTDAKLLYSLLRNIIDNAIKYTDRGGVLVGFRRRNGNALIQVWDTGVGIAPDHQEAVFDEYFQVGNPQRDKAKGLGLGLAIARQVAAILGYRIVCRSRLGKGSTFEISVPLAEAGARQMVEQTGQPVDAVGASTRLAGRRLVLIEDDMMAAKALELSLRAHDIDIATYTSAESALADARSRHADFYIADHRLPGMSGMGFLDELQRQADQPIKAVLLTGETSDAVMKDAPSPRWKVLFKPIDLPVLLAEIDAQVNPGQGKR